MNKLWVYEIYNSWHFVFIYNKTEQHPNFSDSGLHFFVQLFQHNNIFISITQSSQTHISSQFIDISSPPDRHGSHTKLQGSFLTTSISLSHLLDYSSVRHIWRWCLHRESVLIQQCIRAKWLQQKPQKKEEVLAVLPVLLLPPLSQADSKQTGYSPNGGSMLELTWVFTLTMSLFISSGAYSLNPLSSFLTKMCKRWEFCAARCSVSRVGAK